MLSDRQIRALTSICDTLVPALEPLEGDVDPGFWRLKASDLGVPEAFTTALALQPEAKSNQLALLLDIISTPLLAMMVTGQVRPFHKLDHRTRESVLLGWSKSLIPNLRAAFQAFKRLTHALFYNLPGVDGENANWKSIGYPERRPDAVGAPFPLEIHQPHPGKIITCDVVIIGSGAGGGVVAAALAKQGYDVVMLEKGGFIPRGEYTGLEYNAFQRMYEQAGLLTTDDLGVTVIAGSTLGGGTAINWSASLEPPQHVLEEWENDYGVQGISGPAFQEKLASVSHRIGVSADWSQHSRQTRQLKLGCERLGFPFHVIPRNVSGCAEEICGWCSLGCQTNGKNSTIKTYLQDAVDHGARIIVNCQAEKILINHGRAVGVSAQLTHKNGGNDELEIRAQQVVVACGAIHTPALLLRSGLNNPNIGLHLRFHPTSAARGRYAEKIEMWSGPILTGYSDAFSNLDGRNYGALIEVPNAHTGLWASALPWRSGRAHKKIMQQSAYQAAFITLTRDTGSGRVRLDKKGRPLLDYRLNRQDGVHLKTGLIGALRLHRAAGALEISIVHTDIDDLDIDGIPDYAFEDYLDVVGNASTASNRLGVFSAHQMGSARMSGSPNSGVVDPYGKSWEIENLFVADGSLFPTPTGVNPMLTILALAARVADRIASEIS